MAEPNIPGNRTEPPKGDEAKAAIAAAEAAARGEQVAAPGDESEGDDPPARTQPRRVNGRAPVDEGEGETEHVTATPVTAEDLARVQGWTPKEDWVKQGKDPEKWKDAKGFLEYGAKNNALLKERLEKVMKKNLELEERVTTGELAAKNFADLAQKAAERGYERARKELLAEHAQAVKDGDGEAAAATLDKLDKLEKPKPAVEAARPPRNEPSPELLEWQKSNDWYEKDPELRKYADRIGKGLAIEYAQTKQKVSPLDFLKEIEADVKARFPDKFRAGGAPPPSPEGGGGNRTATTITRHGKTWMDIPAEDRAEAEKVLKAKHKGKPIMTKEQYVKAYFGE